MNIALTFNLIRKKLLKNKPVDVIAELDSKETITALKEAIERNGHEVMLIEADENAYEKLRMNRKEIDLVFNIAEGITGESRESYIPCMCEMLGIPYTGSSPTTLSLCLDKARTKEILSYYKIATPKFQVFTNENERLNPCMKYPLIVKLKGEGSKMGLTKNSVVKNEEELRRQLRYLFEIYKRDVIVEEYLLGDEFTVGIIGNENPLVFPPIAVKFDDNIKPEERILLFDVDDPVVPLVKSIYHDFSNEDNYISYFSICPAPVSPEFEKRLKEIALKAYRALGCRDWCRIDMRLDAKGNIHVMELNPIAGIDPSYWLPLAAKKAGLEYHELIGKIIEFATLRTKIKRSRRILA